MRKKCETNVEIMWKQCGNNVEKCETNVKTCGKNVTLYVTVWASRRKMWKKCDPVRNGLAQASGWVPPGSTWVPPGSTWVPPGGCPASRIHAILQDYL